MVHYSAAVLSVELTFVDLDEASAEDIADLRWAYLARLRDSR